MNCVTRRLRIANHMVMDSCCRGDIVNTRFGCSRALLERRPHPKALWWFRASTSNSLSGLSRLHTYTHLRKLRHIHHTFAQQGIRVCGADPFQPPKRQYTHPKALWRFRASTSNSLSGRIRPHSHTHIRHIYYIYAQKDIQIYES